MPISVPSQPRNGEDFGPVPNSQHPYSVGFRVIIKK